MKREVRSSREVELDALEAMEQTLSGRGGVADLLLHPSVENNRTIAAVRDFVLSDLRPDIAMTDPALYRKLCRLRMEMILRGWYHFFKGGPSSE
jgi:hypothetical protein